MNNLHIILKNSISKVNEISRDENRPLRPPKHPSAAHHRHLTAALRHRIPREHAQRAPVEHSGREAEIHVQNQRHVATPARRKVHSSSVSNDSRRNLRRLRQRIVDREQSSERYRVVWIPRAGDLNRGRVRSAEVVVEEEPETRFFQLNRLVRCALGVVR